MRLNRKCTKSQFPGDRQEMATNMESEASEHANLPVEYQSEVVYPFHVPLPVGILTHGPSPSLYHLGRARSV
jgi:hypothetical protein